MQQLNKQIVRRSLGESAADILRDRIVFDELHFGDRLIEEKLAKELNISRICLRDAFSILESEGLVVREKNRYTKVIDFTQDKARDLFEIRIAIETMSLRLFKNSQEQSLLGLTNSYHDIINSLSENEQLNQYGTIMSFDLMFHENIILLGNNRYAIDLWTVLKSQLRAVYNRIIKQEYEIFIKRSVQEHTKIYEEIMQNDIDKAIESLTRHIRDNIEYAIEYLNSYMLTKNRS